MGESGTSFKNKVFELFWIFQGIAQANFIHTIQPANTIKNKIYLRSHYLIGTTSYFIFPFLKIQKPQMK